MSRNGFPLMIRQTSRRTWTFVVALSIVISSFQSILWGAEYTDPPLTNKDWRHWAFIKPEQKELPKVHRLGWVANPIDAFILARLESSGLTPSAPADRRTLLRRVTFDLIGLPPTPAEMDAFLADQSPEAYARVVDRLLASPQYGVRWGQHWLDICRFADSNGFELDANRPFAWQFRDYVIGAFNADKSFDRFLTEQLAGDLLARRKSGPEKAEALVAAGFNRCGQVHLVAGNIDPEEARYEVLTEMTNEVGAAFLGLTIGCARCHDHKFDPVSQGDYFRLMAFFGGSFPKEIDIASEGDKHAYAKAKASSKAALDRLQKQVTGIEAPYRARLLKEKQDRLEPAFKRAMDVDPKKRTPAEKKLAEQAQTLLQISWDEVLSALSPVDRERRAALREELFKLEDKLPLPPPEAWTLEEGKPEATFLLKRGNLKNKNKKMEPAFPRIFPTGNHKPPKQTTPLALAAGPAAAREIIKIHPRLDRMALAHWLTQKNHPLTARVMVNRIWQHHFGAGLVRTPNDFGFRGEPPTHPALLDWLAVEFIEQGWSIKKMHRLMVLSNTYQQESRSTASLRKTDPDNRLLGRMNRTRLEAEVIRDSLLAASGELNLKLGGPPVRTPLEPEVYDLIFTEGEPDHLWPVNPDLRQHSRRSIYLYTKRNVHLPLLETFDQPDTINSCPVRAASIFAPQALIMLNSPFTRDRSGAMALRVMHEKATPQDQIDWAYRLALGRAPEPSELQNGLDFLTNQESLVMDLLRNRRQVSIPESLPANVNPAKFASFRDFCLAILNSNEFIYIN